MWAGNSSSACSDSSTRLLATRDGSRIAVLATVASESLVSVVIPTYNRAHVVDSAISSVLDQTYSDVEVVVADDGSTDDTEAVVRKFAEYDRRVTYIRHTRNFGAQSARNSGIRHAKGSWIGFLDSDDRLLPDSVGRRLRCASSNNTQVVHSDCDVIREGGKAERFGVPPLSGNVYKALLRQPGPVFPALLVRKRALETIGMLDERIVSYQEWDTAIRLAEHHRFAFLGEATFVYDCRGMDTISKDLVRDARGYKQVVLKHSRPIVRELGFDVLGKHCRFIEARYREVDRDTVAKAWKLTGCLLQWKLRMQIGRIRNRLSRAIASSIGFREKNQ